MENKIAMPQKTQNLSNEDKNALFDFYTNYSQRQWFNRAEIELNHPTHMRKTLEIYCYYNPFLDMNDIYTFARKYNLAIEIINLTNN